MRRNGNWHWSWFGFGTAACWWSLTSSPILIIRIKIIGIHPETFGKTVTQQSPSIRDIVSFTPVTKTVISEYRNSSNSLLSTSYFWLHVRCPSLRFYRLTEQGFPYLHLLYWYCRPLWQSVCWAENNLSISRYTIHSLVACRSSFFFSAGFWFRFCPKRPVQLFVFLHTKQSRLYHNTKKPPRLFGGSQRLPASNCFTYQSWMCHRRIAIP